MAADVKLVPVLKLEDLSGLGVVSLGNLLKNDITTIAQVASKSAEEVSELTGLTLTLAKKVLKHALISFSFKINTADNLAEISRKNHFCSTNSTSLDSLLKGGIEEGSTYEFYGAFGSGKTQILFSTLSCFLTDSRFEDKKALIIDTENTFVSSRLEQVLINNNKKLKAEEIASLLKRVYVYSPKTVDEQIIIFKRLREDSQINTITGLLELSKIKFIAVDSLVCLFRATYLGRGTLQERQQKINSYLADLSSLVQEYSSFCIFTNQVVSSPDPYAPEMVPVGGNIVAHASTHRIRLKRYVGGVRCARVMDSPCLPEEEVKFKVDESGIFD